MTLVHVEGQASFVIDKVCLYINAQAPLELSISEVLYREVDFLTQ